MDDLALEKLFESIAPSVDEFERALRVIDPSLSESELLDRALRHALGTLRYDVARETFVRLRWRVEQARQVGRDARESATAIRKASHDLRESRASHVWRDFEDDVGRQWSVHEISVPAVAWAYGPRCLLFETAGLVRRVWNYPTNWSSLSEAGLDQLSKEK
jgi:hypothetical protein